jgi:hypothetical protein
VLTGKPKNREDVVDTPPRGTLVRAADVRRPLWAGATSRRRPSGQERVLRPHDPGQAWTWAVVPVGSLAALLLLRLLTEQAGPSQVVAAVGALLAVVLVGLNLGAGGLL